MKRRQNSKTAARAALAKQYLQMMEELDKEIANEKRPEVIKQLSARKRFIEVQLKDDLLLNIKPEK